MMMYRWIMHSSFDYVCKATTSSQPHHLTHSSSYSPVAFSIIFRIVLFVFVFQHRDDRPSIRQSTSQFYIPSRPVSQLASWLQYSISQSIFKCIHTLTTTSATPSWVHLVGYCSHIFQRQLAFTPSNVYNVRSRQADGGASVSLSLFP